MSLLPVHDRDGPGAGPWIVELWVEEREHLMPVPAPFDGFVEHTKSVSSACLITHDHDRYSVPSSFANQPVSVRVYATRLAVVADAPIVTEHERVFTRDYTAIGMARAFAELAEQSSPAYRQAEGILEVLLKAELAEREVRSVNYQMKSAKFPVYRDLAGFDFTQAQVNEALMRELHRCTFLDDAQNIVLVGGPGSGKTRLATALGVQAIRHRHHRVRFLSALGLANALEQEKRDARQGRLANRLIQTDLVILDELGYLPFSQTGGALLFHLTVFDAIQRIDPTLIIITCP